MNLGETSTSKVDAVGRSHQLEDPLVSHDDPSSTVRHVAYEVPKRLRLVRARLNQVVASGPRSYSIDGDVEVTRRHADRAGTAAGQQDREVDAKGEENKNGGAGQRRKPQPALAHHDVHYGIVP
jgi:hypothetical protein